MSTATFARALGALACIGAVATLGVGLSGHIAGAWLVALSVVFILVLSLRPTLGGVSGHRCVVLKLVWSVARAQNASHAPEAVLRASTLPNDALFLRVRYAVYAINKSQAEVWLRTALAVPAGANFEVTWSDGRTAEVVTGGGRRAV